MVARLLIGLFAVTCFHLSTEGARMWSCDSDRKNVEGKDTPNPRCYVNSRATVRWTLVTEYGATLHLATCYGLNNCSNPDSSSVYGLHYGSASLTVLQFVKIASRFSGKVTCQETLTNGTVLSDTCQVNVARVSFGSTHQFDILENDTRTTYCYSSPYKPSTVTWSLTKNSGQTLDLGTCTAVGQCTSPHAPQITLQRPYDYSSRVSFQRIDRSNGGEIFCSFTYNGLTETDNVTLNVYSPATDSNCYAAVHPGNWSTSLSCDISNVFSSAGDYYISVREHIKVLGVINWRGYGDSFVSNDRISYRDMLTPYTNSTDNEVYYRGRLTYSWPLLPLQGIYTRLSVFVYSGFSVYANPVDVGYPVNITTPSQPTHNCSDLNYIPETGVVPCVCTADYLGSPAGRLVWLLGNIPIATGDYGVTQLTFPSGKVSRQHDGKMVTCQRDWVQPINTALTRFVAHGPDSVTLHVMQSNDVGNNTWFHVISHVIEMKPMKADMVQWGGECQGQQGFTCTLGPRPAAEVDGKTVTCRVTNAANNGHSAEASVVINIFGFTQSQTKRDEVNGTAVGVGIVLGIVIIAFVVVMIILYRRGRLCNRPTQNAPTSQDDDDSHIYTGLKLSKVTKKKRNGAQRGVSCPSAVYQGDGDTVYENTAMGVQGGHM
ncbi:hypothetical protein V1264_007085 [Littorina saxatilis]|uniref:Ig-like domain-containing protein n=1 Tax=Littorina saxatilis TaxID=31220 RepID=A0AAN9AUA0_9CAEN